MVDPKFSPSSSIAVSAGAQLLQDENEQLRTALETALEENALVTEDRDRLLRRVAELARELQLLHSGFARAQVGNASETADSEVYRSQTEEELRVAFEELQVLTEELEVANTTLHEANVTLDARVEERTCEIRHVNAALRASEASFRTISDLVPDLLWRTDRRGDTTWFNQRWSALTGQQTEELLGLGWLAAVHPKDRAAAQLAWEDALANVEPYAAELRIRERCGGYRWFLVRAEPLRDGDRILHWFAAGTDIHDQRIALEALQQSELRFRTLIEGMPQLVWCAGDPGEWTWCSPQWSEYTAQAPEAATGWGWLEAFHPDDRALAKARWEAAAAQGVLELEGRIFHASENRYRHFRTRALPVRAVQGEVQEWLGTSTDVDDIYQLQERQSVLVAELQHRTRNLMAVVHAVTMRTIKGVTTLQDFRKCIDDRMQALARVQSLLSRRDGDLRVPFDALLREELSSHVELDSAGNGVQVSVEGPDGIGLRSATVQTLALAIHELATNAVKYGALAQADGHLHVTWDTLPHNDAERTLRIDWRETGVANLPDPGAAPLGGGYGRELIQRALPYQLGARTKYSFETDGVHCSIEIEVPV